MKRIAIVLTVCFLSIAGIKSQVENVKATLNMRNTFAPGADFTNGIKGVVPSGGKIEISIREARFNTLIYYAYLDATSTIDYKGHGVDYKRGELGEGATYYPDVWLSTDIKTSLFAIDRKYASLSDTVYPFLQKPMNVLITIRTSGTNVQINRFRIPGIGLISGEGRNPLFNDEHFCSNLENTVCAPCIAWNKVKDPIVSLNQQTAKTDLIIAAHRGVWGDNLGRGNPENTEASIASTVPVTPVLESDVMIMKDGTLIISHDYNLVRLSDYNGPDTDYLFNMNYPEISGLHIRHRNPSIVSQYKYLTFEQLVADLKKYGLVLTIDIKDIRARYGKDGTCVDNCNYDPRTNPNANALILESWKRIFKNCMEIAKSQNALEYIAFKISDSYDILAGLVPDEDLQKVLFMPVIQPSMSDDALEKAIDFVDDWHVKAGKRNIAFETNFTALNSPILKEFSKDFQVYNNLLHYVYATTGLRSGSYPDEPVGARGWANRWANWTTKDLTKDIRGDHYLMMSIPYSRYMILTTDRPDVWSQITRIYNNQ